MSAPVATERKSFLPLRLRSTTVVGSSNIPTSIPIPMSLGVQNDSKISLTVGDRVLVNGLKIGTLRYKGTVKFAQGLFYGVELDEPEGKHDGQVNDFRYFQCKTNHGVFVPYDKVVLAPRERILPTHRTISRLKPPTGSRAMTITSSTPVNNRIEIPVKISTTHIQLPDIIPSPLTPTQPISIVKEVDDSTSTDDYEVMTLTEESRIIYRPVIHHQPLAIDEPPETIEADFTDSVSLILHQLQQEQQISLIQSQSSMTISEGSIVDDDEDDDIDTDDLDNESIAESNISDQIQMIRRLSSINESTKSVQTDLSFDINDNIFISRNNFLDLKSLSNSNQSLASSTTSINKLKTNTTDNKMNTYKKRTSIPTSITNIKQVGIPLAKVAIRLYLNLYTTNDGRPPRNIKVVIHGCFDTSSSIDSGSSGRIGGQYYRSPDVPQLPFIPTESQDPLYVINPKGPAENQIPSTSLLPSPNKPIPFSRKPGQCFEQILIIGGSHITMIRSRNPLHQIVGPEINFGGTGYTFSLPSDTYEFEVHFVQPFTMKYVFIPYSANVESFKVEASHAGMLAVFTSKNTNDGLVVDGFPTMLISMLVITITHTTDGYLPSHITFSIGVCNPIYSPSNEGNEIPEITDCTSQLRLFGNPKQVTRVDIKTLKKHMKATNLINPNQNGMEFLTVETHTIDIVLTSTLAIDSITFHSLSNIDSFIIQLHHSHRYYLEITSNIGSKSINKLGNVQANLIRIIILGTEDGFPPNHISLKIAACVPTRLPKIMASPFKNGPLGPILQDSFQPPPSVEISATVDVQLIQEPQIQILPSPILVAPIIEYVPSINSPPQYVENQIPVNVIQPETNLEVYNILLYRGDYFF
ncbi:unnamed protein product [Adineta steineri]|uniref:CAP-Gly domain-containing protein n=1 Tax=Adineta steineri TaxID=433720 RepID=A0A814ZPZ9_9BILA|nr:unnamed protein product [Adineta steineri]CAF1531450.1 unnamed protein product [Adineta steineri]